MLYLYFGNSVSKVRTMARKKAQDLVADNGEVIVCSSDTTTQEMLRSALGAASLFRGHEVFLIDTLSEDRELFEQLVALLPEMKASPNHFVVVEGPLLAHERKAFEKEGVRGEEFKDEKKAFNVFALSDALLGKDKKTLWILLQEAWRSGKTSEELIGTLWWQLKILRLALLTQNAEEAGQKQFVFDKAKRALRNFKEGEVETFSRRLLMLYHEGHGGKRNIDHALEAWVLSL